MHITGTEMLEALRSPNPTELVADGPDHVVVVDLGGGVPDDGLALEAIIASIPAVLVGIGDAGSPLGAVLDVALDGDDPNLDAVLAGVAANPRAATALAVLLRGADRRDLGDGLTAESAVYSMLQAGPEFAAWRAATPVRGREQDDRPTVISERSADILSITLCRPEVHNAFSARMRDELIDALTIALVDESISSVELRGAGPSFCSGGDLDEFGTFPDPATAHLVRLERSAGRVLASLASRVTAHLHGSCFGSGIELPAFAHRVIARPDVTIALPELGMGLIPGAGGTVSLPRRIGRQRTALLALSGMRLDASTAHAWGLVDGIER